MVSLKNKPLGSPLVVQWLGLQAFIARGAGSVPDRETKVLQASQGTQKCKMIIIILGNVFNG